MLSQNRVHLSNLVPIQTAKIHVGLINVKSVANKSVIIGVIIIDNELSLLAVTKTWLKNGNDTVFSILCHPNYTFHGGHRPASKGGRGGGILDLLPEQMLTSGLQSTTHASHSQLSLLHVPSVRSHHSP